MFVFFTSTIDFSTLLHPPVRWWATTPQPDHYLFGFNTSCPSRFWSDSSFKVSDQFFSVLSWCRGSQSQLRPVLSQLRPRPRLRSDCWRRRRRHTYPNISNSFQIFPQISLFFGEPKICLHIHTYPNISNSFLRWTRNISTNVSNSFLWWTKNMFTHSRFCHTYSNLSPNTNK